MAATEIFTNNATTAVTSGGTGAPSSGTTETWTVSSSASFPSASTGVSQFHVADPNASSEKIAVTNVSGTTWTVTRGAESTTPVAHAAGFTIYQVVTAGWYGSVAANPMTASGDTIYGGSAGAMTRLAGDTSNTRKFLREQSSGGVAQPPAWDTIQAADVPTLNQNTTGTAAGLSSTLAIGSGGTGSTSRNFAGLLTPTAVKTTTYSAAAGDYVPCDTTSGGFTVTLPATPADLAVVGVKMVIQGSTNKVTIAAAGSDVFNKAGGGTSLTLTLLNQGALLQYKASTGIWYVLADDLPLGQLDSRYAYPQSTYNVIQYGAAGNGVTDDTAACNAALSACHTAGGGIVFAPAGTYLISSPLVIYSNTLLLSTKNTTWTEAASSNCNMIQNFAVTPNRSVADAAITTGTATLTSATAAFVSGDVGATVAVTGANQASQVLTANIVTVTNGTTVVLDTNAQNTVTNAACSIYYRDSNIEIAGGTWNRNANGYTGGGTAAQNTTQLRFIDGLYVHDMSLSCTTTAGYQLAMAAVTNFTIKRITATAPGTTPNTDGVSVVGPACRGVIDTAYGGVGDDFIALHTNANQGTNSAQVVGNIYDILVTNVFPNGTGQGAVKINSSTGQTANAITVRTVHGTYTSAISFASQQPNITDILIEDIDVISPAASGVNLVYINCPNASLGTLTFKNVALRSYAYSTAINMFQMAAGSNLGTLILENLTWEAGTTGNNSNVLQLLASVGSPTAVNSIIISKVTGQNSAAAWSNLVQAQQYSTIDSLTIRDVVAFTTQAGNYPLFNAQGTVEAVILDGIYLNGGGELVDTASTASAMQIHANNIVSYAAHRLFKFSNTAQTDIILTGINVNTLNQAGLINFGNVNPTVTVRGGGFLNPSNVALFNGSTPTTPGRVINLDARVDVATIATNLGDRAYNTNAASASLGPVIYDGTGWRSLSQPVITAADTSVVVGGTGAAPTVRTGTLDVVAAQHPAAADWSNNSHKITSLLNGSAAQDAAAFGQIPLADATAANILIDGSQAAGANGKWADSGHVHPNSFSWTNADQGMIAQSYDTALIGNGGGALTSGTVYLTRLHLATASTITNILCGITAVASQVTTAAYFGLYNSSGTQVAVTADRHADAGFAATTGAFLETAPLTSTYAAAVGLYWVAILVTWTGAAPTIGRIGINAVWANAGLTAGGGNLRFATYTTGGQTTLPGSFTPSSQTAGDSHAFWFGLT